MKERYGKKQAMIDSHYAQINNIPMASYKTSLLREFYDCAEKHLRALQSLGESSNQNNGLIMMKSKLPRSVLLRLEEETRKIKNGPWKASENVCCTISIHKKQQIVKFDSFKD